MLGRRRLSRHLEYLLVKEWAFSTSRRCHDEHTDHLQLGQCTGNMTFGPAPLFVVLDVRVIADRKLFGTKNAIKRAAGVLEKQNCKWLGFRHLARWLGKVMHLRGSIDVHHLPDNPRSL